MKQDIRKLMQDESDDTDSEEVLSRIGRVPFQWYENFKHFGYDVNAQKITKQEQDDKIDDFIKKNEDNQWWRTIKDELNAKNVILSEEQLTLLDRIRKGKFADPKIAKTHYSVEYEWNEGMFPLSAAPVSKKSFLPSKYERIMINKLVQAIQLGRITLKKDKEEQNPEILEDVWEHETSEQKSRLQAITAPKISLPTHAESYNPSSEYLLDEQEKQELLALDPEDRPTNFIPRSHQSLREVSAYENAIQEQFQRCLDLYLCPRLRKKRLNMTADELLPKLPKPSELRPFPTNPTLYFEGHKHRVLCISLNSTGQFLASCDTSGLILLFEVRSGRCLQKIQLTEKVSSLDWKLGVLLAACGGWVYLIETSLEVWDNKVKIQESSYNKENPQVGSWEWFVLGARNDGVKARVWCGDHQLEQVVFHAKGDYFASLAPKADKRNEQVLVHHLMRGESQKPFSKSKGDLQKVLFHPKKPFFFLVTSKNTYIYNLQQQAMSKKLVSGAQINSCIAIHPQGDNIIVGTHDRRICWFDLDLQNTPYKTLRYHNRSIRSVEFHKKYPLFASCSDDGTIHIFHAMVYNDLMQNALIVPLKVLKGHTMTDDLGVLDITFHPTQPWIFSAGADHQVIMWT